MGILSEGITLGYKADSSGTSYTNLPNLLEIPELGGTVEKVDVTTLADSCKKYINGIKDYGDIAFKFIYDKTQFSTLNGLSGSVSWQVGLPDGDDGAVGTKATFSGAPSVKLGSAGVNGAMTYTLSIALDSDIVFA